MKTVSTKMRGIDKNGRINIPKRFLEYLKIKHGDDVFLYCLEDRIVISDVYYPEFGMSTRGEKKIVRRYIEKERKKTDKSMKRRSPAIRTEKFNPGWAFNQRKKGLSLMDMKIMYEEETGMEIDRSVFSRWIKGYEQGD